MPQEQLDAATKLAHLTDVLRTCFPSAPCSNSWWRRPSRDEIAWLQRDLAIEIDRRGGELRAG